jgi:hypothetical protein
VKKPVFIIGCPRSGTSITLELMAAHENFAWVSNLLNEKPFKIELTRFNKIYNDPNMGVPWLLKHQGQAALPRPVEPWKFWSTYLAKFQWERGGATPPQRQNENDLTQLEIDQTRSVVDDICRYQQKERFLSKYTDFPRIKYLSQVFPDAVFIHVVRDGRAVAYSYYSSMRSGAFCTWDERHWWMSGWPTAWREEWSEKYGCPLSFAAYQWKFFLSEIWEDSNVLPSDRFLEFNYKDLMESPKAVLQRIFQKCDLEMSSRVEFHLKSVILDSRNSKWRERLDFTQQKLLNAIVAQDKFVELLDG